MADVPEHEENQGIYNKTLLKRISLQQHSIQIETGKWPQKPRMDDQREL